MAYAKWYLPELRFFVDVNPLISWLRNYIGDNLGNKRLSSGIWVKPPVDHLAV